MAELTEAKRQHLEDLIVHILVPSRYRAYWQSHSWLVDAVVDAQLWLHRLGTDNVWAAKRVIDNHVSNHARRWAARNQVTQPPDPPAYYSTTDHLFLDGLSGRIRRVAELLIAGYDCGEIARLLHIRVDRVYVYMAKLREIYDPARV